jgi:hypothetical protein
VKELRRLSFPHMSPSGTYNWSVGLTELFGLTHPRYLSSWPWIHAVDVLSKDGRQKMSAATFMELAPEEQDAFLFGAPETPAAVTRRAAEGPAKAVAQMAEQNKELTKLIGDLVKAVGGKGA